MNYGCDSARVFHVSKAGNDSNGGVAQQYPVSLANDSKLTIMAAVNAATSGDTIIIWPGTYDEKLSITAVGKTLHFVGMSRKQTILYENDTDELLPGGYDGCTFRNLTIQQDGTGKCIFFYAGSSMDFIDCDIISNGDGIDASNGYRARFKNCYLLCKKEGIVAGPELIIDGCILATDGTYCGSGDAPVILHTSPTVYPRILIKDSILYAQPSYRKATGKSAQLYESGRNPICITGDADSGMEYVIIDNSILIADGYKPTGGHANSYCSGDTYCARLIDNLVAKNSIFFSRTDQNQSAADSYGLKNCNAQINNCTFAVSGTDSSYDFDADSAKTVYLENTKYSPSQIGANITVNAVPAGITFEKAAKLLVNKAVQNKNTGAIDYYDNDGQTILFTHTPVDDESTITRTPG